MTESHPIGRRDVPKRAGAAAGVRERVQMGYRAVAFKVGKTLSMTVQIAQAAHDLGVPCLVGDMTLNPVLVDWNKNVAARVPPHPGVEIGLLETNGHQHYSRWERMERFHPFPDASWRQVHGGVFHLREDFYRRSGGMFVPSAHYAALAAG